MHGQVNNAKRLTHKFRPSSKLVWSNGPRSSVRPLPIGNFKIIDTELPSVLLASDLLVEHRLADRRTRNAKAQYPVDGIHHQAEAVSLIADGQLQGGC